MASSAVHARRSSGLSLEDFAELHNSVKRGDVVGVDGFPGKSRNGELSIFPTGFTVLSPCLHMLPVARTGLKSQVTAAPKSTAARRHKSVQRRRLQQRLSGTDARMHKMRVQKLHMLHAVSVGGSEERRTGRSTA